MPEFAGILEADALDQRRSEAVARHAVPSWLPDAFQPTSGLRARDTGAQGARLQRHGEAGNAGPTTQISTSRSNDRRARNGASSSGPLVALVKVSAMAFLTDRCGACHLSRA